MISKIIIIIIIIRVHLLVEYFMFESVKEHIRKSVPAVSSLYVQISNGEHIQSNAAQIAGTTEAKYVPVH
jgi:hypothetical protein